MQYARRCSLSQQSFLNIKSYSQKECLDIIKYTCATEWIRLQATCKDNAELAFLSWKHKEREKGKWFKKFCSTLNVVQKDTLISLMRKIEWLKCSFVFSWFSNTVTWQNDIRKKKKQRVLKCTLIWYFQTSHFYL